jgi:peptide chain release factor 2
MLERMYLKWAKNRGFDGTVVEEAPADEAGLRLATFFVRGKNAYGMLESERGVHRLVRISPFDQQHRRQTSFAEVDVVPEIEEGDVEDIEIRPEDLRVETFKASGAGGQYVNKTESAVRIIHVPTNTIVASQQERSQMQNRDVAMNILRAKLVQREREEREAKLEELRGDRRANEWGSQIRSYTLNPFQLVKDHRTGVETGNTAGVLEGDIEPFIWPYLQARGRLAPSVA